MNISQESLAAARAGDARAFRTLVEPHQRELRAYCYRMSGSLADADDLLQESLVRAWRGLASFEGRSSLRTWLYRVTFSACMDALDGKKARMLAEDEGPPASATDPIPAPRMDGWLGPCPANLYQDEAPSPEARYTSKESVALAFLAALQLLPPKQRAMLLARDVLGWSAEECAEAFESTVPSVNSALQRARETLEARAARWRPQLDDASDTRALLARYIAAWEEADPSALQTLLHEDATLAMPPLPMWLRGAEMICASIRAMVMTPEAAGMLRLRPIEANGAPALAAYKKRADGGWEPMAIHVLEVAGGRVRGITAFLDPSLFPAFGLPAEM